MTTIDFGVVTVTPLFIVIDYFPNTVDPANILLYSLHSLVFLKKLLLFFIQGNRSVIKSSLLFTVHQYIWQVALMLHSSRVSVSIVSLVYCLCFLKEEITAIYRTEI